jgi:hypothetical protein
MATILRLASLIGEHCGRQREIPTFILRGRESGFLPHSGGGGRGSVNAPAATTEMAVALLLAMLQRDKSPKDAMAGVLEWAQFAPFMTQDSELEDQPNGLPNRKFLGYVTDASVKTSGCFAVALGTVINILRHQLAVPESAYLFPKEFGLSGLSGFDQAFVAVHLRGMYAVPIERICFYVHPSISVANPPEINENGLRLVHGLGGGVLREIAELLGPLAMAGGGGPRVGSIVSDNDAAVPVGDMPLAALGAIVPEVASRNMQ